MADQPNFNLSDEKVLLDRLRVDDHAALKSIFGLYFRYLCVTAFHFVRDTEKAKDLAQDVFLELWKRRSTLEITSNLKSYLRRAVVNRSLNYLKSQRLDFSEPENAQISTASHEPSAQLLLEAETLENAYQKALGLLPPGCRTIFLLSRIDQKSQKEIAEQLDISTKTVENQMTKALKILRHALGEFLE
jgi:RNA polymerase sigma-70 factor, ECF subfamily